MASEIRTSLSNKTNLKAKLIYRLKFSSILNLPESEFAKLISEVESNPLIQKLQNPTNLQDRLIYRKRFPNTSLNSNFYEIPERTAASKEGVDVESLLNTHKGILSLIKKIGRDNFEKNFLYREGKGSIEENARKCGITLEQAKQIETFILDFSVKSEFFNPTSLVTEGKIHYSLIARIEKEKSGKLVLSYLSPHLACGGYVINRDKITSVKKTLNPNDKKDLTELIKKIEWINSRQNTIQRTLNELMMRQETYLKTNSIERKQPFNQRELAKAIHVTPSTVCRAIYGKSVELPWGEEKPLKDLFINKKEIAQKWIGEIFREMSPDDINKLNDTHLRELLFKRYNLKVSRRSVNLYRRAYLKSQY